ncbi:Hypothetical predicted protein [Olea europaea subsp. europaea]|uniref:Uncharacterized protein n=1 Tax=Olea europaea subsp. europaea TaxID=158383 RepID=A0A8S0S1L6_OLEEU|nr:Hypothetical predicted protein [Olea europaea subsp. europaea]
MVKVDLSSWPLLSEGNPSLVLLSSKVWHKALPVMGLFQFELVDGDVKRGGGNLSLSCRRI